MLGRIEKHYGITLGSGEKAVVIGCSRSPRADGHRLQDTYTPDRESPTSPTTLPRARRPIRARPASHLRKPSPCSSRRVSRIASSIERSPYRPRSRRAVRFENMTLFMRLAQLMRDTPSLSSVDLYETDLTRIAMLLLDFMDGIAVSDTWRAASW
ncbi:MAG: hypothetical protein ACLT98_07795 [Eggerthellaceae bacterium]